jgi:hypothetical protein
VYRERPTLANASRISATGSLRILEPMNRITLNVILSTIFGADGAEREELRGSSRPYNKRGQVMALAPAPPFWTRWNSRLMHKLDEFRKAFDRIRIHAARSYRSLGVSARQFAGLVPRGPRALPVPVPKSCYSAGLRKRVATQIREDQRTSYGLRKCLIMLRACPRGGRD